jgi:vacuolar-type H+-ATPase subunit H
MTGDTSLLEQVRTKELELKEKEDQARKEAEQIISEAKSAAEQTLVRAREDGSQQAVKRRDEGMAKISEDLEQIRERAAGEKKRILENGESRIAAAADKILERVAFP